MASASPRPSRSKRATDSGCSRISVSKRPATGRSLLCPRHRYSDIPPGGGSRMDAMSARFAVRGQLVFDGRLAPGAVVVEDGRILEVQLGEGSALSLPQDVADAAVVAPGFVDLQVNGGYG